MMETITRPVARVTDPETSHEAAQSVYRPSDVACYIAIMMQDGACDDPVLIQRYNDAVYEEIAPKASEQSIRSRRAELTSAGIIEWSGEYSLSAHGRRTRVWKLADKFAGDVMSHLYKMRDAR